ncbi:hypothetical protein ACLOJK_039596 [Asimina triloba]
MQTKVKTPQLKRSGGNAAQFPPILLHLPLPSSPASHPSLPKHLFAFPRGMQRASSKRDAPLPPAPNASKRLQQWQPPMAAAKEEEMMDEDVFLEETLLHDKEVLRDEDVFRALQLRLSKWKRPSLSPSFQAHSQSISTHNLLILPFALDSSFPATGDRLCD